MRGIDIIEALQDIDEALILRAKQHKKGSPPWLRYISLAALFCCALLLGLLAINRIISPGEKNIPDMLAPTEESTTQENKQDEFATSEVFEATQEPSPDPLPDQWQELAAFATYITADDNRNTNLTLACEAINGIQLQPGDLFSFNDVVGQRTLEKGYKEAPVYTTVDSEPVIGGGISQASSTLYACCLYGDLEITERQGHTFQVSYVPGGMDAAVFWDSADFKFRNNTDSPLLIKAYIQDERLWCEIFTTESTDFKAELGMHIVASDSDDSQIIYALTRDIYDLKGNLIRTDTPVELDAMGGLGTTVYSLPQDPTTSAALPAAEVTEHPAYVVTEEDLVMANGISMGMTPDQVTQIMGTPSERSTNIDGSAYLSYPEVYFNFGICTRCGSEHLVNFGLHDVCGLMPLGFDLDTPLKDVLARFEALDAEPSYSSPIYRADETHYAMYTPLDGSGLVIISIYAGDYVYSLAFNRQNKIYICYVQYFQSADLLCPEN